jgi:peptidoglycan/LPS O-acetylase OafA/YrhL
MEIPALTSLRYCAAIWVVFYHFSHFTDAVALQEFPLITSGYLGVDFFFILSGFVLTHVYQPQMTWNAGILRIFPEFLIGMSLHRFGDTRSAGPRGAVAGLLLSTICVLAALLAGAALPRFAVLLATVAVLGLAGIVFFAADANRYGKLIALGAKLPVYLGEISYSVYMVHLGVGIMLYDALLPRWRPTDVPTAVATVLTGLVAATIVSMLTYRFIEVSGRRWLIGRARMLQAPALEARHDA